MEHTRAPNGGLNPHHSVTDAQGEQQMTSMSKDFDDCIPSLPGT